MKVLPCVVSALVLVGFGCGGQGGSNDTTAGTQADSEMTSTSTSTTTTTTTPTTGATADATTGTTMEPTTGGPDKGMFCAEQCMVEADCLYLGVDVYYSCKDNLCVRDACVTDSDCVIPESLWSDECAVQADCGGIGYACIDIGGGVGRCAGVPQPDFACDDLGFAEVMYPPIEGGDLVVVCAELDYLCKDGSCRDPCESDDDCFLKYAPFCNKDTGRCSCRSDADCQIPGLSLNVCIDGRCGCATDADCVADDPSTDRCYEGTCGCSSAAVCDEPIFDGATVVCQ